MKDAERVDILRAHGFTGIDLPMISKLKQPEIYGIQLTDEARRCLGIAARPKRSEQRQMILDYVERMGSITSLEATMVLQIMSFTKRMSELRRDPNYEVTQKWESNGHSKWLRYEIKEVKHDKAD